MEVTHGNLEVTGGLRKVIYSLRQVTRGLKQVTRGLKQVTSGVRQVTRGLMLNKGTVDVVGATERFRGSCKGHLVPQGGYLESQQCDFRSQGIHLAPLFGHYSYIQAPGKSLWA